MLGNIHTLKLPFHLLGLIIKLSQHLRTIFCLDSVLTNESHFRLKTTCPSVAGCDSNK